MAQMVGKTTASDLMDFLQKTRNKTPEDKAQASGTFGPGFASVLAQAINEGGLPTAASSEHYKVANIARCGYEDLSKYVNQSEGYKQFRNTITSFSLDWYDDDMIDSHTGDLNQKGLDYKYLNRLEMAKPILPQSIEECDELYVRSHKNLTNYTTGLLEQNGLRIGINLENNWTSSGLSVWGVYPIRLKDEMNALTMSEAGKEVKAMCEETSLYRSISTLAKHNVTFRNAYNANPNEAVDLFYKELGELMDSGHLPRIDTNTNAPVPPQVMNALDNLKNKLS
ncbi:MAG: hypothetical protein LUH04_05305 [Clostridium sp.]|nr:hypothetical protein [Clostridium sp.]